MFCVFSNDHTEIRTPYYRDFYHPELYYEDIPYQNFTPYDLFCIKTQLSPHVRQIDSKLDIGFGEIEYQGAMYITVMFFRKNVPEKLSLETEDTLRNKLKEITDRKLFACLLDIKTLNYSHDWLRSMMPFLVEESVIDNDFILISIDPESDYDSVYNDTYFSTLKAIETMSQEGYITLSPENTEFIYNWELEEIKKLNNLGLYRAKWKDSRLTTNISQFLMDKLNGDLTIQFRDQGRSYLYDHIRIGRSIVMDNISSLSEARLAMISTSISKHKSI